MTLSSSWRPLQAPGFANEYFVKYTFEDTQYRVLVTNLRELWEECLELDVILTRANESNCPIDASEDASQRQILLENLAQALQGKAGTSIFVRRRQKDDALILDLKASLPDPLPELEWHCNLLPRGTEGLFDNLTAQLIQKLYNRDNDVAQLQDIISSKDNVIKKLLDRLESMNIDLTTVFPGTSNMRLSSKAPKREQIGRHVRGLLPFDRDDWKTSNEVLQNRADLSHVIASADQHSSNPLRRLLRQDIASPSPPDRHKTSPKSNTRLEHMGGEDVGDATESETDDDDFQVQELPSKPTKQPSIPLEPQDDVDRPTLSMSSTPVPSMEAPVQPEGKPKARIGTIGRRALRRQATPPANVDLPPQEASEQTATSGKPKTEKKPKLGTIGGKRTKIADDKDLVSTVVQTPRNLEGAGGESEADAIKHRSPSSSEARGREATVTVSRSSPPRATSEERANRRREELKRQIESKPVGGAKKKRKF
ncbi:Hypothetical protein D9617_2g060060 [Elsinoe fawcettii]|nr:Hypothetical protein D9617_2g060060 [Elsinoe fawcettii]